MTAKRCAAVLALVAGAVACSGPLRVSGPGLVVETEPAERPPDPEVAEVTATVPRGMALAVTSGPEKDGAPEDEETRASAERPEPAPASPEPGSGGTPSGAQERIRPDSERPPSPAPDPSVAAILTGELDAGRTEAGRWRDFVLAVMDRLLGSGVDQQADTPGYDTGDDGSSPSPAPEPPEAPEPDPPVAGSQPLRELIERDKAGYDPETVAAAAAKARTVYGLGFPGLAPARRDAFTALCYWSPCETLVPVIAAGRAGDWETAAGETYVRMVSGLGHGYASVLREWLQTGEYRDPAE